MATIELMFLVSYMLMLFGYVCVEIEKFIVYVDVLERRSGLLGLF